VLVGGERFIGAVHYDPGSDEDLRFSVLEPFPKGLR
jgi:hypothetical protein